MVKYQRLGHFYVNPFKHWMDGFTFVNSNRTVEYQKFPVTLKLIFVLVEVQRGVSMLLFFWQRIHRKLSLKAEKKLYF